MLELTAEQVETLKRLRSRGFELAAFPLYASKIGVRKGNCAALLEPAEGDGLRLFGDPSYLVAGNLSVLVGQGEECFFVWKKNRLPATAERLAEMQHFASELADLLAR